MSNIWVIADIRTGLIVEDEFYRERVDALDGLRKFDGNSYTVMTEDAANELNLDYIREELEEDIESNPECNTANEDEVENIRQELISESRAAEEAEEEGWRCR